MENEEKSEHVQIYNLITNQDPGWQNIIYELISTERLDPWNIDLIVLCRSYFERIKELEKNNFHISSKMLLVASLLLRIKSEVLMSKYIKEIDDILFGKQEEISKIIEKIELNEDDIPVLSSKTPLPRFKRVTLQELISALDTAIKTESRRINKEIAIKQAKRLSYVDIPKFRRISIKERIRVFYAKILNSFNKNKDHIKMPYSHFTGNSKEEKISCFLPMLYLSNTNKLWLEQEKHFDEIFIYIYESFKKNFPNYDKEIVELEEIKEEDLEDFNESVEEDDFPLEDIKKELKSEISKINQEIKDETQRRVEKLNKDFENPIGNLID